MLIVVVIKGTTNYPFFPAFGTTGDIPVTTVAIDDEAEIVTTLSGFVWI